MNYLPKKNIFLCILFFGALFRFYNLNFDNLWYDEIISFWASSPERSFENFLKVHKNIEIAPFTFNYILKNFYLLFGYEVEYSRILPSILSFLSIVVIFYLVNEIGDYNSSLLATFLISFNIFLISYAQEQRVYSILFFFSLFSILFFFKLLNKKVRTLELILFFLGSLILILLHIFSIFIIAGYALFLFLNYFKKREIFLPLKCVLLLLYFVFAIFYIPYLLGFSENLNSNLEVNYFWNKQPSLKFYTNFYFSNFFGSRLLGLIFLTIFIYLIFKNKNIFLKLEKPSLLLIIILISYSIPLIFGYIFKPILLPRYIIFIPGLVVILLSILISYLKNNKIRIVLTSILVITTIGNMFTEQTLKQFYTERIPGKPRYTEAIKFINNSKFKTYSLKIENMWNNEETKNAINNYINHLSKKNQLEINFLEIDKIKNEIVWIFCPMDINEKSCSLPVNVKNFEIIDEKNFNSINLKLIRN